MEDTQDYPLVSAIALVGKCPIHDIIVLIDSFKSQTYPYKELIIVNNTKNQLIASKLNIHAQKDIYIVDTPINLTSGMARNYGISSANGSILAQFDPDYYHHPKRLEIQIATLAKNDVHISVLNETLQYSFISGKASYNKNDKQAILGTMVLIRPRDIDYPNVDANEEKLFLEKLVNQNMKVVSISQPELACKLCLTHYNKITKVISSNVSDQHLKLINKFLKTHHSVDKSDIDI